MGILAVSAAALIAVGAGAAAAQDDAALMKRVDKVLADTPLIDGHNDLPWEIRERFKSKLSAVDLTTDTSKLPTPAPTPVPGSPIPPGAPPLMTDIARMRAGHMGGQFWSVWVPSDLKGPDAVETTVEQIDLVKQMAARWPETFEMAYTAADVRRIHKAGKIACLIGIEGGHQIDNSLPVLREMYALGARYMTLTHFSNTEWADSATDAPVHRGLTPFGKELVLEMNRMGMLIDLAHVSADTMRAAIETSRAPVIFSHSSARALVDHPRDVPDDVLKLTAEHGGVVMVNFYPGYVSQARNEWSAARSGEDARLSALYVGQPDRRKAALEAWDKAHPKPHVGLKEVADHIDYVRKVAGVDHVGLGSDFDGIPEAPEGLDAVDKYPALLMELMRRGWSDQDIAKLAGGNVLRVMAEAEAVAAKLKNEPPATGTIAELDKPTK
jgi:membrane dipeptidase